MSQATFPARRGHARSSSLSGLSSGPRLANVSKLLPPVNAKLNPQRRPGHMRSASEIPSLVSKPLDSPLVLGIKSNQTWNVCPWDGFRFPQGVSVCHICGSKRGTSEYQGVRPIATRKDKLISSPSVRSSPTTPRIIPLQQEIGKPKPKWRRVMYCKQPYRDNYVDSTFLYQMTKNVNMRHYEYWSLFRSSLALVNEMSSVALFIVSFLDILQSDHPHSAAFGITVKLMLGALSLFIIRISTDPTKKWFLAGYMVLRDWASTVVLLAFFLFGTAPILMTLTDQFSNNTIWALTTLLLLVHLLFYNYHVSDTERFFHQTVSLNAAIFVSALLASRLNDTVNVFILVSLAIALFGFFPMIKSYMQVQTASIYVVHAGLLGLYATLSIFRFSTILGVLFCSMALFISFLCPFWLIWLQRYKNEIHGPWDEAVAMDREEKDLQ